MRLVLAFWQSARRHQKASIQIDFVFCNSALKSDARPVDLVTATGPDLRFAGAIGEVAGLHAADDGATNCTCIRQAREAEEGEEAGYNLGGGNAELLVLTTAELEQLDDPARRKRLEYLALQLR